MWFSLLIKEKDVPMLFASEIHYQPVATESLREIATELKRALPDMTVTAVDKRSRPTGLQSDDMVALKLQQDDQKKPFMLVGPKGADISAERATRNTLEAVFGILSEKLELQNGSSDSAALGVVLMLVFIVIHVFIRVESGIDGNLLINSVLAAGSLLFFAGLALFGIRSFKAALKGRSLLALLFMLPGFLMMAPLSLLNIPLINYFRREHGRRLCRESLSPMGAMPKPSASAIHSRNQY